MKNPNIKTKVVHSMSKAAWNVIGSQLGTKFKIARVPYLSHTNEEIMNRERKEALEHAEFISWCFNNSDKVMQLLEEPKTANAEPVSLSAANILKKDEILKETLLGKWKFYLRGEGVKYEYRQMAHGRHDEVGDGWRIISFIENGQIGSITLERNPFGYLIYTNELDKLTLTKGIGEEMCIEFNRILKKHIQ